ERWVEGQLYEWHEQQRSWRTERPWQRTWDGVHAQPEQSEYRWLMAKVDELTDTEYLYQGEVQDPVVARQKLLEVEQAAVEAERETAADAEQDRFRGQRTFRTADAEVRPWYNRWAGGLIGWEALVQAVGTDMAEFIRAAATVDPAEVETQSYEVNVVPMAEVPATVNYETDDDAETMIMGVFPGDEP
ncbi:unnamed protein product, partial [Symbiodinium sp. KB8]